MNNKDTQKIPNGFDAIKVSGGIKEYRLKINGLKILLMEKNIIPTVTVMVTYHVGSRNEVLGNTGATHILEHMLFKGSRNFNKKNGKDQATYLQKMGARVNATTWLDRTNYYQTLPSEHLEEVIALEADRMRFARITDADLKTEMPVVMNEFERGENDPIEALDKAIWATAFYMHPYHHSTIGWKNDIEATNATKLKIFYDTFYHPNNATLTVIGDFDQYILLTFVKKYFGEHKKSSHLIPEMLYLEPVQEGKRRVEVKRLGETNIVGLSYRIPAALSVDTHAVHMLASILGVGDSSRLARRLVDTGLCSRVYMVFAPFHDESLMTVYAYIATNVKHTEIEKIIIEEIELLKIKGITVLELNRIKAKVVSEMAWSRDGSYNTADSLNEAIALGDWTFYTDYLNKINTVKVEDVLRVANKYLLEDSSVAGYFIGQHSREELTKKIKKN